MNDGRNKTAQITLLNFNSGKPSTISAYNKLFRAAKESFLKALTNFEKDGGKDGPFGTGYAVCRLAILLLQCGDNGSTMDILVPKEDDINTAGKYLQNLEDSDIPMNKILSLHYLLAKSDYQFRRGNVTRALEHGNAALQVSEELNLMEFVEHAHNRVLTLQKKSPVIVTEISNEEEDFQRLLENIESSSSEVTE